MTSSTSLFIEFALEKKVLQFGDFLTKAGRNSPYFFNLGAFNDGESLKRLGEFYANKIIDTKIEFDMIFGPAYKGIPLASSTSIALSDKSRNIPYSFNRKETKNHGEGGEIIGSSIKGGVLVIDDVISAGTSINEAISIIKSNNGKACGIVIAIDRQEKGMGNVSATQDVSDKFKIPALPIITLDDIIQYLVSQNAFKKELKSIENYRNEYGVN